MKTALIYWYSFLAILVTMTSCKAKLPEKVVVEKTKEVKVTETLRDTIVEIVADSSYYQAYIECINDKPFLKKEISKSGKTVNAPKVDLTNNKLTVDCTKEAEKLFFSWKEKFIQELSTEQIPIVVPAEFTQWEIVQMWCGRFFLLQLLALIIYIIYKIIKR